MGYDGIIMTDDLAMNAITKRYSREEAAILAILAGNDLLCTSYYSVQYPAVLEAVTTGAISMEQLDAAVLRILRWKMAIGLIS
jgi:beta-N-acetylhexosaminidase